MLLYLFCNKSHYENVPFEIPENWCWTTINDIAFVTKLAGFEYTKYIANNISKNDGIPLFKGKNVLNGEVVYEFESYIPRHISDELFRSQISKKCLLTPYVGTIGNIGIHNKEGIYHLGSNVGKIELFNGLCVNVYEEYVKFYLLSSYGYKELTKQKKATAQESISIEAIREVLIPLPPVAEQLRIVNEIDNKLSYIKEISKDCGKISELIGVAKSKILDLAISGKLVPQDPNDEPAIELLKRINPGFKPCDNSHYGNLPENWEEIAMGEICKLYDGEKVSGPSLTYIDVKYLRGSKVGEFVTSGKYVPQGSTLILVDGENSGEVFTTPIDGYQGSTFKILGITEYLDKEYVLLLIKRSQKLLRENKVGSAIPHLNKKMFKELIVPVPPLAGQKRIVAIVNMLLYKLDMITAEL